MLEDAPALMPRIEPGCWRAYRGRAERFGRALVATHARRRTDFVRAVEHETTPPCTEVEGDPAFTVDEIARRVLSREISERRIARVSGEWVIVPCNAEGGTP